MMHPKNKRVRRLITAIVADLLVLGAFLGAWLGGVALQYSGSLLWVWQVDIALALLAALVNLPIKEAKVVRA